MSVVGISTPQRIALIGPGAIGCCLAAALADNGHEVLIGARQPFERLVIEGDLARDLPVRCAAAPSELAGADLVVLATKAHQTMGAADWLVAAAAGGAPILVAQNGVDHRARIAAILGAHVGAASVVPAVVYLPAHRAAPGRAVLEGRAALTLPRDTGGEAFAAAFADSFVRVDLVDDWLTAAWTKLLMNAASGAITALLGRPISVLADPEAAALARDLMREAIAVGRAEGAGFADDAAERIVAAMVKHAGHHYPSITQDRRAGLPTEWQARNEVIVRLAGKHGIDVPLNRALTTLLRLGEPSV
ncbi:MAG: 2-dehydropantoate 2-reductase [Pseudomonadales bacterium]|nr:2-dehydropantoate 2-reductase [Pseudomonadales bacterium]